MQQVLVKEAEDARQRSRDEFLAAIGWSEAEQQPLRGDASFRRYIRLRRGAQSAMLMDAPPEKENVLPYLAVARHLLECGYSAPRVLGVNETQGFVALEDLGDDLYSPLIGAGAEEAPLYDAAVDLLLTWAGDARMQRGSVLKLPDYSPEEMLREAALFSEWFLPAVFPAEDAARLGGEYMALWREVLARHRLPCTQFVHRDFHAENLLWLPQREGVRRVGLLDFQDALYGHAAYDLASLLEDARRDVSPELRARCLQRYLARAEGDEGEFRLAYALLGAQRNCKIIGIFVRLSRRDGKHHYLPLLSRVWDNLAQGLSHPALAELREWMERHIPAERRAEVPARG